MLQRIGSLRLKKSEKETGLQRFGSLRLRPSEKRERVRVRRAEVQSECEPDTCFEVTDYFQDDVRDPWRERDALERERLSAHAQVRDLVQHGETHQLRTKLQALGRAAEIVTNLTPDGANTLLYVATEAGLTSSVAALLDAGADGRAHPVTKYSPLYIAAYHGHVEIAKLLLLHFPHAVQQETVEKWLPLHAACIGGHAPLVKLLLEHPFPDTVLNTYTDPTGAWQWRAAFDVNARDASGQTAIYIACSLGHYAAVDALLSHTVPCTRIDESQPAEPPIPAVSQVLSPHRAGISLGIHAIVSKLTGSGKVKETAADSAHRIRPVRIEVHRVMSGGAGGADSCLAAAVRGGHAKVVTRLLAAGANPDAPATAPPPTSDGNDARNRSRSAPPRSVTGRPQSPAANLRHHNDHEGGWTALAIAARASNMPLVEMLVKHGATDPQCRALKECARLGRKDLLTALLATKAYPDPDYKLNKSALSESVFSSRDGDEALTYSAVCPTTPVMVSWSELKCHIQQIRMSWLRAAALRVNSKLSSGAGAIHAITRLDISNNELRTLPPELFTLLSLRYLNAAQNKLERLPSLSDAFEEDIDSKGRRMKRVKKGRPEVYSAPVLQEVYLQDNRLEELPPELFNLRNLSSLDVSNNKIRALPAAMWSAASLAHLNAALNHLRDLPARSASEGDSVSPTGASTPDSQSVSSSFSRQSTQEVLQRSISRNPSIDRSETESVDDDVPIVGDRAGNAVWSLAVRAHPWRGVAERCEPASTVTGVGGVSPLTSLNLSHNQLTCVPAALACLAPHLVRLNLAYNSLRTMSYVTSYPTSLRQIDLSHNEITCWPSLPQVENFGSREGDPLICYCGRRQTKGSVGSVSSVNSGGSVRSQLLSAACPARKHLRLEGLRTLILANNLLTRIQLTTDDDGDTPVTSADPSTDDDDDWGAGSGIRSRLVFPLLSMLDVSCNLLRSLPNNIHELSNIAVLNISGNKDITDLPPTMGLLSRLWNLSAAGCSLQEPLHTMLSAEGGASKYRSMDVVSYLKSVLQEAKPYARMKLMLCGLQGIGKTSLLECLRQESAIQHRRKPTDHWAKRMGNKTRRGGNMSTVGVDIGTWTYEKQRSTRGPVTFRTWDFGGQQEYYATHQYFLSRRSLYLVLWKVTDGRKGLAGAVNWLRSIQARAPGSPVIMVATHYDQVAHCDLPESESPEALQRLIRSSIMGAADADKLGLPRVLDSLEVSCSTRHNIRLLADIIYSVAFSVKPPGSKEPLLEQRVPATYLALEECVTSLAAELQEPVLRHHEYKRLVTQYMIQKNHRLFRDAAELHQATMFLHENGVLLHYDDATLKELYFLRPQWLCDVLAHVVTVREINPFAANGIMKIEDLAHVFKASPQLLRGEEASSLGVSLLNKFELALCWDGRVLLVPPLLPQNEPVLPQLPLRTRNWAGSNRGTPHRVWPLGAGLAPLADSRGTDSPTLVQDSTSNVVISGRVGGFALRRLLLLSYVPCGFWPRLCSRVVADSSVRQAAQCLYTPPTEMELDETITKALDLNWGWKLWRTGLKLVCGDLTLVVIRELPARRDALLGSLLDYEELETDSLYRDLRLRVKQEGAWCSLDVQSSACVEILLPSVVCCVRHSDHTPIGRYQSISLEPNQETLARVLALIADHVDLLLEDWYPSLGTRFVHTSEGRCLITRVVPCPACLRDLEPVAPVHPAHFPPVDHVAQAFRRLEVAEADRPRRLRLSEDSRTSDADSGVDAESNASSRVGSVEGVADGGARVAFGWSVEECILCACTGGTLYCAHHTISLRDVAPDTLLLDVSEDMRARWESVSAGCVCGRGAFGTVLAGEWRRGTDSVSVAIKALQPVPPPPGSDTTAFHAYKAALSRWERDPTAAACRAYCGLRQELGVLTRLAHPHVVPLLGVCGTPLALLLPLAPQGALDGVLRAYRGCGARVRTRAARALALQAARALEYLHARRIVYRDLKSENVLVWAMPRAQEAEAAERSAANIPVHIKLADYGISRLAPPSGTKGFGGTEGFMAPEIMRYNGEEEYNEKVDCFSYGMLLYEIITLRQPFEGHEAVKEAVLEGARPTLDTRELQYPCCMLECMRRCWLTAPELRPSAAALVCVGAAPEFTALQDACQARTAVIGQATSISHTEDGLACWEVWYAGEPERVHTISTTRHAFTQQHTIRIPPDRSEPVTVTAMCKVGNNMWLGDSAGRLSVYNISTCGLVWCVRLCEVVGGAGGGASGGGVASLLALPQTQRVAVALQCGRHSASRSHCSVAGIYQSEVVGGAGGGASGGGVASQLALPQTQRVAVALQCGRLFLVTSSRVETATGSSESEASFVLSELGAATRLCCLAAVSTPQGLEVWAGGDGLYSYTLTQEGVSAADVLQTPPTVTLVAAPTENGVHCEPYIVAYTDPGVCVYQWSVRSKQQTARLDCSKLAPCSESLQSIAIDEHLADDRCKVQPYQQVKLYKQVQSHKQVQPYQQVKLYKQVQSHKQVQPYQQVKPYKHVHSHKQVQPYKQVKLYKQVQPYKHVHSHKQVLSHKQVQPHKQVHSHKQVLSHKQVQPYKHVHSHKQVLSHKQVQPYKQVHSHKQIQPYKYFQKRQFKPTSSPILSMKHFIQYPPESKKIHLKKYNIIQMIKI
ncbi:hypothetical protein O0L34_g6659 [Tuta absoluta]|nr:hypothetical protein O0L34_g6659 [Tuta absoluta]